MTIPLLDLGPAIGVPLDARPELLTELAPPTHPLALLPVRIETRFFARDGSSSELRVRIYPDQIHIDSHDPSLSAEEVAAGKRYWELRWRAAGTTDRLRSAWRTLVDRHGAGRAAWIARALAPTNPADAPTSPLDEGAALMNQPAFPNLGEPATVVRTPRARGLPTRWVATTYQGGQVLAVVAGNDIATDLAVGPDPDDALAPDDDPTQLAVDDGMRWMVDFDRAEELGMALRVPLSVPLESAAVDALVVVGVSDAAPTEGAERLAALLDAHHYTDGLAFVGPGTPTNNTTEERAGFTSRDARGEQSFALEWPDPAPEIGPVTDAGRLGSGLGLPTARVESTLGRIAGATASDEPLAAALQTALWPATWGYYLSQFTSVNEAGRDWVRGHARRFLRPAGVLPTLRCGRQPYGVLPVTSLAGFTASGDDARPTERLGQLLTGLRDQVWRPATFGAKRIGRSGDVDADVADVLRGGATSIDYAVRRALGPHFLSHLRLFLGEDLDGIGFFARLRQITSNLLNRVGVPGAVSLDLFVYEDAKSPLRVPLVRHGTDGTMEFVEALLGGDPNALATPVPDNSVPLLHALLRHALLREQAEAAARLLAGPTQSLAQLLTDAELVDLVPAPAPTPTWSWQRSQPMPGATPGRTVGEHLAGLANFDEPALSALGELREAMAELATAEPAAVERLLPAVLDTTSYRLDAWVTSLATRRLAELRTAQPEGLVLGAYGWVEHLRHEPQAAVTELPAGEPGPLSAPPDDPGFIVAPSLDQATAAALMREAHLAHGGSAESPFAIKLTSDRVRLAERLFEGVRQGIPLGTLLGYDVERRLHDAGIDEFIDDLRRIAPPPDKDGEQAVADRTQIDGLVLHRKWDEDADAVLAGIEGLAEGQPRREKLVKVLAWLAAAVDAAADAVTAEGVYQLARGNLARAATLDDVAGGIAPPPRLEFVRTPRTGTAITHRVAIVLDANATVDPASGWADTDHSPRAQAEPRLDAWAARMLGPAVGVDVVVAELDGAGGVVSEHRLPLSDLRLSALDFVWISGDAGATTELAQRAYAATVPSPAGATPALRLVLEPADDRTSGDRGRDLGDLLELAGAVRRLIAGARPLDGGDLQPAHADADRRADLDELEARVDAAHQALVARRDSLGALLDDPAPTVGAIRSELAAIAGFGVAAGTGTIAGADADPAPPGSAAFVSAGAVFADVKRRVADADREGIAASGESEQTRRERLLRRVQGVFGPGFIAVPVFRAPTAADLDASRRSPALLAADPLGAHTWVTRMERVRPGLARMTLPYRLAEVLGTGPMLDLAVAHVPHTGERGWVGLSLEAGDDGPSPDGVVSIVLAGAGDPADVDLGGPLAGMLVDEWTEVVPNRDETAGLAFRYDPPDAMAPQAMLLAVPPDPTKAWTVGSLNRVLLETLDLAHLRAVGPESIDTAGHFLPATMLAFNVDGDAVSTDPNTLITAAAG
jgi:hypothetical protein